MTLTPAELRQAPLWPNQVAAGVKIGARASTVQALWGEAVEIEQIRPDFVRWSYDGVWGRLQAGQVDQIGVYVRFVRPDARKCGNRSAQEVNRSPVQSTGMGRLLTGQSTALRF